MTPIAPLTRDDFDHLVEELSALAAAANALELELYRLGEIGDEPRVAACRHAASELIGQLRHCLFRWDQAILPLVEPRPAGPR
jgi:hypothetical protein